MDTLRWRPRVPKTFQSWTVKQEGQDEKSFNRWTNLDLIPTPEGERNFTGRSFFGFWYDHAQLLRMIALLTCHRIAAAVNISAWTLGSANLANGLTPGETIGMVFIGSVLAGVIAFFCGEPGVSLSSHFHEVV
jgi:NCS1 family nucleobase:cation symporter-1